MGSCLCTSVQKLTKNEQQKYLCLSCKEFLLEKKQGIGLAQLDMLDNNIAQWCSQRDQWISNHAKHLMPIPKICIACHRNPLGGS